MAAISREKSAWNSVKHEVWKLPEKLKPCILRIENASEERFSKGRLLLLLAVVLVVVVLVVVVLGSGSGCFGCGSGCLGCLWVVVLVVVALLVVFAPSLLQPEKLKQLKVESPGSLNP